MVPLSPRLTTIYVCIRNPHNNKSVVCERRTADLNFQEMYNSAPGTRRLPESGSFMFLNSWYRERLGIFDTKIALPLEISDSAGWRANIRALRLHPSAAIRASMVLAYISIILGLLGIVLGILGLRK